MKNFLISLFFACIFTPVVLAEEPVPSNVTLQLLPGEPNEEEVTIFDQAKTWLEIGAYFNQNYPDAFIEEDLSADVRRFFPANRRFATVSNFTAILKMSMKRSKANFWCRKRRP